MSWSEPLYTADEVREAEGRHPGYPESMQELIERAGRGVADVALRRFPDAHSFAVVCGGGSNGGDGRVAARALASEGRRAEVVDAKAGELPAGDAHVVVDALFGTGFSGRPRDDAVRVIEAVNGSGRPVLSIDVPSGVDASTGQAAVAVRATVTATVEAPKLGLCVAPGLFHAGDVEVVPIGLDLGQARAARVTPAVLRLVPRRERTQTKYTAGSVLVVGGAPGMTGAAALAARAAFRADAGYVAVAAPPASIPVLETLVVEAVKRPLREVGPAAARASAVAIGPGLGRSEEAHALVRRLLNELDVPAVVDADALFELRPFERDAPTVLTPHEGELAGLLRHDVEWVRANRLAAVEHAAGAFESVVLLKGPDTLIAAPGEGTLVVTHGTPSLATAGTGDVLTGVVAAFLAKGMEARVAAAAAATLHGLASQRIRATGAVAGDLADALSEVLDASV